MNDTIFAVLLGILINALWEITRLLLVKKISKHSDEGLSNSSEKNLSLFLQHQSSLASYLILLALIIILHYFDKLNFFTSACVFILSSCIFIYKTHKLIISFHRYISSSNDVGIASIDPEIHKGLDYEKSLDLCERNFYFLGIGSHKLVTSKNFEAALQRCATNTGGSAARILLCHPESEALKAMEMRNNVPENTYKDRIIESLRILDTFIEKDYGIEVRLYNKKDINDMPVFRLMLIDDEKCLTSFHVVDKSNNEGRKLPQINISNNGRVNGMPSFYKAFSTYYEGLWKMSKKAGNIKDLVT